MNQPHFKFLPILAAALLGCPLATQVNAAERPNIIFILAGDQAWWDYSFMYRPDVEGPAFHSSIPNNYDIYQVAQTPAIDLTGIAVAELEFYHARELEVENGTAFDFGYVNILSTNLTTLTNHVFTATGTDATWRKVTVDVPPAATGQVIVLEFRMESDEYQPGPMAGWYIDDVSILAPSSSSIPHRRRAQTAPGPHYGGPGAVEFQTATQPTPPSPKFP